MNARAKRDFRSLKLLPQRVAVVTFAWLLLVTIAALGGGTVTNCTEANLRAAMAGGGMVAFACDGTITLASAITIAADTSLDGSGHQITISGNYAVRVFLVGSNVNFTAVDLAIADAKSQGGSAILNLDGKVNLSGVSFRSNSATIGGLDQLTPPASGGAIFNRGGTVCAINCSFAGNSATGGRGLPDPEIGGPGLGGAIHNSGMVMLDRCTLTGNSATGGAARDAHMYGQPGPPGGEGSGGAIYNQGTLIVDRTTVFGNTATGGSGGKGAVAMSSPTGLPGGNGGAANGAGFCNLGSLWVTSTTLASNVVTGGAGGPGGAGVVYGSVGGNGGDGGDGNSGFGGAIFSSGSANMLNCTIASNSDLGGAGGQGGAGAFGSNNKGRDGANGNGGSGFGGLVLQSTANIAANCLLVANVPSNGSGLLVDSGHNLSSDASCSLTNIGSLNGTEPLLGPLADNGGPTLTMALLAGSPAIDAGDSAAAPPTDQRGVPRPFGAAADIGAYEYATLLAISRAQGSGLDILLRDGNPGQTCRLLTSTTLSNWVCVATNQVGPNGTFLFQENCDAAEPQRFYKSVLP